MVPAGYPELGIDLGNKKEWASRKMDNYMKELLENIQDSFIVIQKPWEEERSTAISMDGIRIKMIKNPHHAPLYTQWTQQYGTRHRRLFRVSGMAKNRTAKIRQ